MKPGWKTTEFWLSLAAMILTALFASGALADGSTAFKVVSIVGSILTALGYTVGRSWAKVGDSKAKTMGLAKTAADALSANPSLPSNE